MAKSSNVLISIPYRNSREKHRYYTVAFSKIVTVTKIQFPFFYEIILLLGCGKRRGIKPHGEFGVSSIIIAE